MRLIIAGSRSLAAHPNPSAVMYAAIAYAAERGLDVSKITEVIEGEARGADLEGKAWAVRNGIPVREMPAQWRKSGRYNPRAGFERNEDMAEAGTGLLVVWDGQSTGSRDMMRRARRHYLPTWVYTFDLT